MSIKKVQEFRKLVKPLVKWLNDNHDPHTKIIIECNRADLLSGLIGTPISDYIKRK